ncbi:hypothetical protein LX36DRAFT_714353 [Colletotrichum falcatum]|nr:hypothetical protein LX36DRAFT_714353 [Colletotrichum falcatum]
MADGQTTQTSLQRPGLGQCREPKALGRSPTPHVRDEQTLLRKVATRTPTIRRRNLNKVILVTSANGPSHLQGRRCDVLVFYPDNEPPPPLVNASPPDIDPVVDFDGLPLVHMIHLGSKGWLYPFYDGGLRTLELARLRRLGLGHLPIGCGPNAYNLVLRPQDTVTKSAWPLEDVGKSRLRTRRRPDPSANEQDAAVAMETWRPIENGQILDITAKDPDELPDNALPLQWDLLRMFRQSSYPKNHTGHHAQKASARVGWGAPAQAPPRSPTTSSMCCGRIAHRPTPTHTHMAVVFDQASFLLEADAHHHVSPALDRARPMPAAAAEPRRRIADGAADGAAHGMNRLPMLREACNNAVADGLSPECPHCSEQQAMGASREITTQPLRGVLPAPMLFANSLIGPVLVDDHLPTDPASNADLWVGAAESWGSQGSSGNRVAGTCHAGGKSSNITSLGERGVDNSEESLVVRLDSENVVSAQRGEGDGYRRAFIRPRDPQVAHTCAHASTRPRRYGQFMTPRYWHCKYESQGVAYSLGSSPVAHPGLTCRQTVRHAYARLADADIEASITSLLCKEGEARKVSCGGDRERPPNAVRNAWITTSALNWAKHIRTPGSPTRDRDTESKPRLEKRAMAGSTENPEEGFPQRGGRRRDFNPGKDGELVSLRSSWNESRHGLMKREPRDAAGRALHQNTPLG